MSTISRRDQKFIRMAASQRMSTLGSTRRTAEDNSGRDGEELLARMQARHSVDPRRSLLERLSRLASVLGPFERKEFSPGFVERLQEEAAGRKIFYVSTPVTGGFRLYEFLAAKGKRSVRELSGEDKDAFVKEVIEKNCAAAAELAESLRNDETLVVDPSRLAVKHWQQAEYLNHWLDVVKVAAGLVLQDGWELSEGCVHEARAAFELGIPVTDARGENLTRGAAMQRVEEALDRIRKQGFTPLNLADILRKHSGGEAEVPEPKMFTASKLVSPLQNEEVERYDLPRGKAEKSVVRVAQRLCGACEDADERTRKAVAGQELIALEDALVQALDQERPEAVDAMEALLARGAEKLNGAALPAGFHSCGQGVFTVN
ncbi:MAG: hypothetical protein AB1758_37205, partial [Candidatus Eremiobacterota bacterium]